MNKKNTQKQKKHFQLPFLKGERKRNFIEPLVQNSNQILSIIGVALILILGVMFTKVQPEHLKASFFGRFFPKTEEPETNTETEDQANSETTLGFYRFDELQEKYFPIPETKNIAKATNYDYTPATFALAQQSFNALFENTIQTMQTSSEHITTFDQEFTEIQKIITSMHTDLQPSILDLVTKVCNKQDADGPDCG